TPATRQYHGPAPSPPGRRRLRRNSRPRKKDSRPARREPKLDPGSSRTLAFIPEREVRAKAGFRLGWVARGTPVCQGGGFGSSKIDRTKPIRRRWDRQRAAVSNRRRERLRCPGPGGGAATD